MKDRHLRPVVQRPEMPSVTHNNVNNHNTSRPPISPVLGDRGRGHRKQQQSLLLLSGWQQSGSSSILQPVRAVAMIGSQKMPPSLQGSCYWNAASDAVMLKLVTVREQP